MIDFLKKFQLNIALVGVILFTLGTSGVHSQVTYDGCYDINGIPVASVAARVDNVAIATIHNGHPVIFYNPQVLSWFHPVTREFWYFHECAHHALGHAFRNNPLSREKQADCWAIVNMKKLGLLSEERMAIIQNDIRKLPGDGWVYLPGPQRAISFEFC
ncbi:hypothetical protein [uncultured Roseobacter sp.]|uniref:hypothetical protein n=1 Tax=uncultured Roseobacter sp. TaxID=114847 RepID=UPI0026016333|nr:hypothetical protein [uncultured Roseobacter sp.]